MAMGLMSQFNQQQQPNRLTEMIGIAKQLAGNDPRAVIQRMADSGMTYNLPDGRTMTVAELARMAEGKTPQQLLSQLGIS